MDNLDALSLSVLGKMVSKDTSTIDEIADMIYEDAGIVGVKEEVLILIKRGLIEDIIPFMISHNLITQKGGNITLTFKGIQGGQAYKQLLETDLEVTEKEYLRIIASLFNNIVTLEAV